MHNTLISAELTKWEEVLWRDRWWRVLSFCRKDCDILYINDSKQLSEKKREELYDVITKEAVAWAVGYASPERIDEINILQATYEAMREAIGKLSPAPDLLK